MIEKAEAGDYSPYGQGSSQLGAHEAGLSASQGIVILTPPFVSLPMLASLRTLILLLLLSLTNSTPDGVTYSCILIAVVIIIIT